MTPNKPEIEEVAQDLVSPSNSAIENTMLRLISRLANTITYNAGAMNKLVDSVDTLESQRYRQVYVKKHKKKVST